MTSRNIHVALEDFRRARREAVLKEIMARLTGKSADLLSFEEVRQKLHAMPAAPTNLEVIPVDAIVGSVGRYHDFTRDFLPRRESDAERWARVKVAGAEGPGLDPIDVYKIGEVYFVLDGNHRVSIARRDNTETIHAYVTELQTKVPLTPDVQPDDLIVKAEFTAFLEATKLDQTRPQADLTVTAPGRYKELEKHIAVLHYLMIQEEGAEVPYPEAAAQWYDMVYEPVVEVIRTAGILRDFPGRTETDLYVWITEHRGELTEALGWSVSPEVATADLASRYSPGTRRAVARLSEKLIDAVTPDELEKGPPPGRWREEHQVVRRDRDLFADILVAVGDEESSWYALDQGLQIVRRSGARLYGLHVVSSSEEEDSPDVGALREEFNRRCLAMGIHGEFAVAPGKVARLICDRARWTDLVVLNLAHPPAPQPFAKLGSGFRTLIRRCSRPILAVPGPATPLARPLLAYDGSPKAEEALFISTFMAGRWGLDLDVLAVVADGDRDLGVLEVARDYLDTFKIAANYVQKHGPVAQTIISTAAERQNDLIIMGGYGFSPVLEVVLGSAVDQVLRESHIPILICR